MMTLSTPLAGLHLVRQVTFLVIGNWSLAVIAGGERKESWGALRLRKARGRLTVHNIRLLAVEAEIMSKEYTHNPDTMREDIALVEMLKGTADNDSQEFYNALDNILRFSKWAILGTNGALDEDS